MMHLRLWRAWLFWKEDVSKMPCAVCGKLHAFECMKYMSPTGLTTPGFYCPNCWGKRWDNA